MHNHRFRISYGKSALHGDKLTFMTVKCIPRCNRPGSQGAAARSIGMNSLDLEYLTTTRTTYDYVYLSVERSKDLSRLVGLSAIFEDQAVEWKFLSGYTQPVSTDCTNFRRMVLSNRRISKPAIPKDKVAMTVECSGYLIIPLRNHSVYAVASAVMAVLRCRKPRNTHYGLS